MYRILYFFIVSFFFVADLIMDCLRDNLGEQEDFRQAAGEVEGFAVNHSEVANMMARTPTIPEIMT